MHDLKFLIESINANTATAIRNRDNDYHLFLGNISIQWHLVLCRRTALYFPALNSADRHLDDVQQSVRNFQNESTTASCREQPKPAHGQERVYEGGGDSTAAP